MNPGELTQIHLKAQEVWSCPGLTLWTTCIAEVMEAPDLEDNLHVFNTRESFLSSVFQVAFK